MARRNRPRKQRRRTPLDDEPRDRSGVVDMTNERPEPRSGDVRSIEPGSPADVAEREDRGGPDVVSLIPDPPQREFVFDEPDEPGDRETLAETEDHDLPESVSAELDAAPDEDPDPWAAEAGSFDDDEDDLDDLDDLDDEMEAADELDRIPSFEDGPDERTAADEAADDDEPRADDAPAPSPAQRTGRLQRPIDAEFGTGLGSDEVRDGETIGYLESALGDADDTGRDVPGPSGSGSDEAFDPASAGQPGPEDEPAPAAAARPHLRLVRPGEAPPPPVDVPRAVEEAPPAVEPPPSSDVDDLGPEVLAAPTAAPVDERPAAVDGLGPDAEPEETRWEPEPEPSYPSEARLRRQRMAAREDVVPPLPEPGTVPRMAPLRARVAAMVVDGGLLLLFVPLTVLVGVLAFGLDGYRAVPAAEARGIAFSAVNGLLLLSLAVYFGLSQGFSGSTPGKRLMHIKVVRAEDGEPIGFGRSLLRVAAYGLNLLTLGGGFLYALYDPRRRGLHDILTQTFVAKDD